MARRMFSDEITKSDAFLDMPAESQLAYWHLGMEADDDGFLSNLKMIQRMIGASDDAIRILFAKKFLIPFDSGVCVIKHWRINNYIRKDIYQETKYLKEKSSLFIRENGSYTTNPDMALPIPKGHFTTKDEFKNNPVDVTSTTRRDSGYVGKVRLGKVRLGKDNSIDQTDWVNFWDAYPTKKGKEVAERSWLKINPSHELAQQIIEDVKKRKVTDRSWLEGYIPNPSTYLNQKRWNDEITPQRGIVSKLSSEETATPGKYSNIKKTVIQL
jgi:hypothetical protein